MRCLLTTLLVLSSSSYAGTILVPKEMASISSAVDIASNGDVILVAPGVYNETVNFRGKAITIESTEGRNETIIDSQGTNTCVIFTTGETSKTILRGFTITGGIGAVNTDGRYGGGIFLVGSSPTIEDCAIVNNNADWGGGVHNIRSSAHFINCLFQGNTAVYNGGAMRSNELSEPVITNCTFTDNIAQFGGAMDFVVDSIPNINGCNISGNGATVRGGAIYVGCGCSAPNIANTAICWNVPEHIIGDWNDNGGNEVCAVCEADITRDGVVDIADVLDIINAWGAGACVQDITGEGGVDISDLLVVVANWGPCE